MDKCLAYHSSSILLIINTYMSIDVCFQQQEEQIWIMVLILRGVTINLVIAFFGFDTSPIFCHGEPQERKEIKLCEQM